MFILRKEINLLFHLMLLQVHKSLVKSKTWLMLNNVPWHIAYAIVLGLESKEFEEHSPKV